jgi:hypothetical protein
MKLQSFHKKTFIQAAISIFWQRLCYQYFHKRKIMATVDDFKSQVVALFGKLAQMPRSSGGGGPSSGDGFQECFRARRPLPSFWHAAMRDLQVMLDGSDTRCRLCLVAVYRVWCEQPFEDRVWATVHAATTVSDRSSGLAAKVLAAMASACARPTVAPVSGSDGLGLPEEVLSTAARSDLTLREVLFDAIVNCVSVVANSVQNTAVEPTRHLWRHYVDVPPADVVLYQCGELSVRSMLHLCVEEDVLVHLHVPHDKVLPCQVAMMDKVQDLLVLIQALWTVASKLHGLWKRLESLSDIADVVLGKLADILPLLKPCTLAFWVHSDLARATACLTADLLMKTFRMCLPEMALQPAVGPDTVGAARKFIERVQELASRVESPVFGWRSSGPLVLGLQTSTMTRLHPLLSLCAVSFFGGGISEPLPHKFSPATLQEVVHTPALAKFCVECATSLWEFFFTSTSCTLRGFVVSFNLDRSEAVEELVGTVTVRLLTLLGQRRVVCPGDIRPMQNMWDAPARIRALQLLQFLMFSCARGRDETAGLDTVVGLHAPATVEEASCGRRCQVQDGALLRALWVSACFAMVALLETADAVDLSTFCGGLAHQSCARTRAVALQKCGRMLVSSESGEGKIRGYTSVHTLVDAASLPHVKGFDGFHGRVSLGTILGACAQQAQEVGAGRRRYTCLRMWWLAAVARQMKLRWLSQTPSGLSGPSGPSGPFRPSRPSRKRGRRE